jgi:hypothetical protein
VSEIKPPVSVAVIGGTGDGGMTPTDKRVLAHTADDQPNLYVRVVTPIMAIAIRGLNLFLITFSAALGLAGIDPSNSVNVTDFKQALVFAGWMGLVSAFVGTVKNLITVFGQLEGKYPLGSGSI